MQKKKEVNLQYIIWGFALTMLLLSIAFGYYVYSTTDREMAEQFSTQQVFLAQEAATGIEEYLMSLRQNMLLFKELSAHDNLSYPDLALPFFSNFSRTALTDIWMVSSEGEVQFCITHPQMRGHSIAREIYFYKAQQAESNQVYTSVGFKLGKELDSAINNKWIILSLRLNNLQAKEPTQKANILIFLISVDKIVSRFISPIRLGQTGYAWLFDENGVLLHHPEHPEMIDRSIFKADSSCWECHVNYFEAEKRMLSQAESGKGEFLSATGERKLIAHSPIHIGNRIWTLVVTASYSEITLLLLESFYQLAGFVGLIAVTTLGAALFILRINKKRMEAESKAAYTRQLEKEVAERTQEIKKEEQKLNGIVSAIGAQLSVISPDKKIYWANDTIQKAFGTTNFEGRYCYQMYYQRQEPCPDCPADRTFQDGQFHQHEQSCLNGERKIYYQITTTPIYNADGQIEQVLELTQDITLNKLQEQNLFDSQKMLAVGQISLGLAHDLGNPLSIIAGSAQFCLQKLKPPKEIQEHLTVIARNASASAKVIKTLLQLARPTDQSEMEMQAVSMVDIVHRTLLLLSTELAKKSIKTSEEYPDQLPFIWGDKHQLEQVMVNIILNSIEALSDHGGIKVIMTINVETNCLCVSFIDNGPGFPKENIGNVFEPFFTTRMRGVGLGLSVSKRIIEAHRGVIKAENASAGGAKITLCIPIAPKDTGYIEEAEI
ncbi:MAG: PAS domain-containing protein [Candidatus Schekmanbacteria bacterium]|nr:PAS domain-containing protein [Candidatus Schekmanbacteria bacterium]